MARKKRSNKRRSLSRDSKLGIERLEDRALLSTTTSAATSLSSVFDVADSFSSAYATQVFTASSTYTDANGIVSTAPVEVPISTEPTIISGGGIAQIVQNAPTLVSPANGAVNARVNPTFAWNNLSHATSYVLQLFVDNPDNAVNRRKYVIQPTAGSTTSFTLSDATHDNDALQYGHTYYWTVRGQDTDGLGPVSQKWSFTTRAELTAPALISPANGATHARIDPTFQWSNVNNATSYVVQLFVDNPSNAVNRRSYVVQPGAGSTTSFTLDTAAHDNDPLDYNRTYYWTVRAQTSDGDVGPASQEWGFTTDIAPVTVAPTLVNPTNGQTGRALSPSFEWNNVPNATDYILQLYVLRDGTTIEPVTRRRYIVPRDSGTTTVFTFSEADHDTDPLDGLRTFFWDVVPRNSQGDQGPISQQWSFTTHAELVTEAPTLENPDNNYTTARVNPTFKWANVPNATSYVVQLYADTPDNTIARRNYVVPAQDGATTSFELDLASHDNDPLDYARTYYWVVRGQNSDGDNGPASDKWKFTTVVAPVTVAPTLVNPTNGQTGRALSPSFEWNNVPNATDYILQLYVLRDGTTIEPVTRRSYIVPRDSGATTVFTFSEANHDTDPLDGLRTFYWDVVPRNSQGDQGPISQQWSFTTHAEPVTAAPTLENPDNNYTTVRVNPTFKWANVPNATSYVVQLYADTPDNTIARRNYVVPAQAGDSTSFELDLASHDYDLLDYARTYYWVVRGQNSDGDNGPASDKWKFTTRDAPPAPKLVSPVNGAPGTSVDTTFTWKNVANINTYVLQLFVDNSDNAVNRRRYVVPASQGSTTSFTISEADHDSDPLQYGHTYYWVVRAETDDGDLGPASDEWSFATASQPVQTNVDPSGFTAGAFNVDSTGAATYSIPIEMSPGVGGMQPTLALAYNSQAGNGLLGQGWSLAGLSSITRSPETKAQDGVYDPVDFDSNDRFSLDGQRLMVVAGNYGDAESEYRTEQDSFAKILAHGQQAGDPASFTVQTKDGLILEYGATADSRLEVQGKSAVSIWALDRVTDRFGNYWTVKYYENLSTGEFYPTRIDYTANDSQGLAPFASVVFSYEARPDDFYGYADGSRFSSTKRLQFVRSYYQNTLVREYKLDYLPDHPAQPSYLSSVTESDGEGVSFAPLQFTWDGSDRSDSFLIHSFTPQGVTPGTAEQDYLEGDINGDGRTDLLKVTDDSAQVWIATGNNKFDVTNLTPRSEPLGSTAEFRMGDFNGDGLADAVHFLGLSLKTWFSNGDGTFRIVDSTLPESFGNGPRVEIGDFDGDGRTDIIHFDGDKVEIATSHGDGTYAVKDFAPWAGYDVGDGSRFVATDLNGDGRTDFLHFYGNVLNTWIANDHGTFDVTSSDPGSSVDNGNDFRIASINGDNKTDLFHFTDAGDIDIWESRGNGDFTIRTYDPGAGFSFGGGRVKVADFNDDGYTDVLSFYSDHIDLYLYTGQYSFKKVNVPLPNGYAIGEEESFAVGDWNGDGAADLLQLRGSTTNVLISDYQVPEHITAFNTPLGPKTTVDYESIAGPNASDVYVKGTDALYPIIDYQRPLYVVASESTSNGIGGLHELTYKYGDAEFDLNRKAMLGFGSLQVIDIDTGIRTTTQFGRDKNSGARYVTHTATTLVSTGQLISELNQITTVEPPNNGVYFVHPSLVLSSSYDLDGSLLTSSIVGTAYDNFGNVIEVDTDYGDGYVTKTSNSFDNLTSAWLIGLLRYTTTTYSAPGTATEVRTASYSYHPGTRAVEQEVIEPDEPTLSLVTTNEYDGFGNVIRIERGGAASAATGSFATHVTTTVENGRTVAHLTFDPTLMGGSLPDGDYQVVIAGDHISAGGVSMGSDLRFSFFRFFGDSDGDRDVDATDFSGFLATYRRNIQNPSYSAVYDADADGDVDATDLSAFLTNYRKALPKSDSFDESPNQPLGGYVSSVAVDNGSAQRGMVRSLTVYFDRVVYIQNNAFRVVTAGSDQNSALEMDYSADGRFVEQVRDSLGHANHFETDPVLGLQTKQTDANGLSTEFQYDEFGRLVKETDPASVNTVFVYGVVSAGQGPTFATRYTVAITDGSGLVLTYYDSLFRPIRSITTGFDGTSIYVDQQYDALGRVSQTSDPYFAGSNSIVYTTVTYDALSRPVTIVAPGNQVATTHYAGRQVTTTNPVNQSQTEHYNAVGQLISVVDNLNGVVTYQYDAAGELIKSSDAEGNVTRMEYDDRGNQTLLDDPDLGVTKYTYDVFGEVTQAVNAKQQTTKYAYDQLGRLVSETTPEGISTWQYDVGTSAIGMLTKVTGPRGYQYSLTYDSLSRLKSTTLVPETGAAAYTVSNEYDNLSRLQKLTYPSGFSVRYVYNSYGYLTQITADGHSAPIWQANQVNARGQLVQQTLGNGTVTNYQYDPVTGYLRGIVTPGIQNLSYDYDNVGSLTRRTDNLNSVSESFQYDGLERLDRADVFHGSALASTITVNYSASGRITYKSDVGHYNYGSAGTAQPYAVQSITNSTGAILDQYAYDADGNRTQKNGDAIVYNSFDQPVSIKSGDQRVDFTYSPGGERVRQRVYDAGQLQSVKTYVDGIYEVEEQNGKTVETNYISAPTGLVAIYEVVNGSDKSTEYLHEDELGSVQAVSDENGHLIETDSFDAWGQRRDPITWLPGTIADSNTSRGFTGQEQLDDVGLVHMNGRVYDPAIGQFLSADPFVQDPLNSQNYDRYTYVLNNPVSLTDPSGYWSLKKHLGGVVDSVVGAGEGIVDAVTDAGNQIVSATEDAGNEVGEAGSGLASGSIGSIVNVGVAIATGNRNDIARAAVQGAVDYGISAIGAAISASPAGPVVGAFVDAALESGAHNAISGWFGNDGHGSAGTPSIAPPVYAAPNAPSTNSQASSGPKNSRHYPFDDDNGPGTSGTFLQPADAIAAIFTGGLSEVAGPAEEILTEGRLATSEIVNQGTSAVLKNGYYEVNGFKFSKYYYEKLWTTGRGAPSLVAKEVLESAQGSVADAVKPGFFKYVASGWELIYNPVTKEVWHLQPIK